MSLSRLTEPGGGGVGASCLSGGAGDNGTMGRVLQTQLPHVSEDGLHMKLRHQLLDRTAGTHPPLLACL